MKGKVEEPGGDPLTPSPLVFEPGNLGESVCNYDVFITGWFVALPLDVAAVVRSVLPIEYGMDDAQNREAMDICIP